MFLICIYFFIYKSVLPSPDQWRFEWDRLLNEIQEMKEELLSEMHGMIAPAVVEVAEKVVEEKSEVVEKVKSETKSTVIITKVVESSKLLPTSELVYMYDNMQSKIYKIDHKENLARMTNSMSIVGEEGRYNIESISHKYAIEVSLVIFYTQLLVFYGIEYGLQILDECTTSLQVLLWGTFCAFLCASTLMELLRSLDISLSGIMKCTSKMCLMFVLMLNSSHLPLSCSLDRKYSQMLTNIMLVVMIAYVKTYAKIVSTQEEQKMLAEYHQLQIENGESQPLLSSRNAAASYISPTVSTTDLYEMDRKSRHYLLTKIGEEVDTRHSRLFNQISYCMTAFPETYPLPAALILCYLQTSTLIHLAFSSTQFHGAGISSTSALSQTEIVVRLFIYFILLFPLVFIHVSVNMDPTMFYNSCGNWRKLLYYCLANAVPDILILIAFMNLINADELLWMYYFADGHLLQYISYGVIVFFIFQKIIVVKCCGFWKKSGDGIKDAEYEEAVVQPLLVRERSEVIGSGSKLQTVNELEVDAVPVAVENPDVYVLVQRKGYQ